MKTSNKMHIKHNGKLIGLYEEEVAFIAKKYFYEMVSKAVEESIDEVVIGWEQDGLIPNDPEAHKLAVDELSVKYVDDIYGYIVSDVADKIDVDDLAFEYVAEKVSDDSESIVTINKQIAMINRRERNGAYLDDGYGEWVFFDGARTWDMELVDEKIEEMWNSLEDNQSQYKDFDEFYDEMFESVLDNDFEELEYIRY